LRVTGLPRFRTSIAALVPFLADRVEEPTSWDDVRMLRVQVNRLRRWEQHREGHTDIPHRAVVLAAMLTTLLSNVVQRHQRVAQPSASGQRRAS
jgi:hypothetical protein